MRGIFEKMLAWIDTPTPLRPEVQRRVDRDVALRKARDEFIAEHGREPSHNELWAICPPEGE